MALINKLLAHVAKHKDTRSEVDSLWESYSEAQPVSVRIVLYRECEKKGKKLLFDSNAVERRLLSQNSEAYEDVGEYTEINDGYGFIYLPPGKEVKMYSEMILGSVALTHQAGNMKLHTLGEGGRTLMWSSIVQAPKISQGPKSSNSSLASSFGCSLGSFHRSEAEDLEFPLLPGHLDREISSNADSGCFPSYPSSANIASFVSTESGRSGYRRRLSSNVDTPDYGSLCSLQRRYLSTLESNNQLREPRDQSLNSLSCVSSVSLKDSSRSELGSSSRPGSRTALLGVCVLVEFSSTKHSEVLLSHSPILEDIIMHLLNCVKQAYTVKKRFVVTVYNGYLDCARMIQNLFCVPRLKLSAWHLTVKNNPYLFVQEQLVTDVCMLIKLLNTKETNFFFSTLITGILTHHLGWVSTVMPGSKPGINMLHKPSVQGLDQFRNEQWYDPVKVQYNELHGMLGSPVRLSKSLILSTKETLSKTLLFVISYFLRCSLVFENVLAPEDILDQNILYKSYILRQTNKNQKLAGQNSSNALGRCSSSPKISQRFHAEVNTLEALDLPACCDRPNKLQQEEKVGFLLGADDSSPTALPSPPVFNPKKGEGSLYTEREEEINQVYLTAVPFSFPSVMDSVHTDLPSLICFSPTYMPGSVLQSLNPALDPRWRSTLHADLLAVAGGPQVSGLTSECVSLVADLDNCDVSLVSAQQVVVGRPGLPVPMSPMVATIFDNFLTLVELGLSTEVCLNYLEDQLQQIYLESCSLSEYLLSADYTSLQNISKDLQVDPFDIPLLLAVSSTHTPAVGKKLSLGFTA